ncbi:MAG: NrfD/PsrC family molybdoenzyme membrane anchor subunit [Chloroflexota bacterium]
MPEFFYPNEAVLEWDSLIVIYPYITGLVAGAFIVSSLYHVFGLTRLQPVARFSLLVSLAFLLVCPLPLLLHLGRPERALEMFLRPNLLSAMSGFGYIWLTYLLIVVAETWLVFRADIVRGIESSSQLRRTVYSLLSLGIRDLSETALTGDKKLVRLFALVGIPAACLLHGYVGFIFGAVKANPWWSTPLMPIIFLVSAIVSGIALLMALYVVAMKIRRKPLDHDCLHFLALWLGGLLTVALALEGLEVLTMYYESEESWGAISELIVGRLAISYFGIQFLLGSIVPILLLGSLEITRVRETVSARLRFLASILVLVGVFAMRWNVVIGGQLLSKSLRGVGNYTPPLFGEGSVVMAGALLLLPFLILAVMSFTVSPWQPQTQPTVDLADRWPRFSPGRSS